MRAHTRTHTRTNPRQIFSQAWIRIKAYQSRLQGGAKQNDGPRHKMAAAGRKNSYRSDYFTEKSQPDKIPRRLFVHIFGTGVGGRRVGRRSRLALTWYVSRLDFRCPRLLEENRAEVRRAGWRRSGGARSRLAAPSSFCRHHPAED